MSVKRKSMKNLLEAHSFCCMFFNTVIVLFLQALGAASVVVPSSNCYALDNSSHIYDFNSWIGQAFEYEGKDFDWHVRFCKDVESRSQSGYVNFGRFEDFNQFLAGSGHVNFVQEFYNGDLTSCETTYDKRGRTAQVNIICGNCLKGECKGGLGCICSVPYESACRVIIEMAIPCEKKGQRVFEGFTVGFHPRSWELVFNGMTQLGYEKSHHEFSFKTEQTHVALYMTAITSVSHLVRNPTIKVSPEHGLEVKLSGSGATGIPPTTLSPTVLMVDWTCNQARDTPYEVEITVPIENYESIQFTLTKMCEYRQHEGGDTTRGWAVFGVISCVFVVFSTLFFCGGFVYKTRVQNQHGLDALPGMTILSACLETVSGGGHGYTRPEDINSAFVNQASWDRPPVPPAQGARTSERKYGSM